MALVVGDIGTVFKFTFVDQDGLPISMTTATTVEFIFTKPDCTTVAKTAVATANKGEYSYVTVAPFGSRVSTASAMFNVFQTVWGPATPMLT